jgi:hypothetical protein
LKEKEQAKMNSRLQELNDSSGKAEIIDICNSDNTTDYANVEMLNSANEPSNVTFNLGNYEKEPSRDHDVKNISSKDISAPVKLDPEAAEKMNPFGHQRALSASSARSLPSDLKTEITKFQIDGFANKVNILSMLNQVFLNAQKGNLP